MPQQRTLCRHCEAAPVGNKTGGLCGACKIYRVRNGHLPDADLLDRRQARRIDQELAATAHTREADLGKAHIIHRGRSTRGR